MTQRAKPVLLGRILAAHGVRGDVLIKSFTQDPAAIASYGPLQDADGGRTFDLHVVRVTPKGVIARLAGVGDRTSAEAFKGTDLYVPRERLPATEEDTYYHADLIGMSAVDTEGRAIGQVVAIADYGAGELLEIRLEGSRHTELVPFTRAFVPEIDTARGHVVVRMPVGTEGEDEHKPGG